jgi:hypothetical protein
MTRDDKDWQDGLLKSMKQYAQNIANDVKALELVLTNREDTTFLPAINATLDEISNFASMIEYQRMKLSKHLNA